MNNGIKEVVNKNVITCPKCGEKANVTKGWSLFKGGVGLGIGASILSSGLTFGTIATLGLASVGTILSFMLMPMILAFLIIFLPIYAIIQCFAKYNVDCPHCKSKFKLSNKAYFEIKDKEHAELKDK